METTEYKPTYEQLEAGLSRAIMVMESAARQIKSKESHIHYIADALNIDAGSIMKSVQPPPTYEEVTVERWECAKCTEVFDFDPSARGCFCGAELNKHGGVCEGTEFFKLTGTRRVPVKQPVRKRVSVEAVSVTKDYSCYLDGCVISDAHAPIFGSLPECHGKTGTLAFEWEE